MDALAVLAAALFLPGRYGPSFIRRGKRIVAPVPTRRLQRNRPSFTTKTALTSAEGSDAKSDSDESPALRPDLPSRMADPPANGADEIVRFDSPFLPWTSHEKGRPILSALVVLNTPIARPPSPVFRRLWELSSFRVCADGGANRLYEATVVGGFRGGQDVARGGVRGDGGGGGEVDLSSSSPPEQEPPKGSWIPDLIRGDLDSLRPDVQSHYEYLGCRVERDPDQDSNDLDKALKTVRANFDTWQADAVGGDGDLLPTASVFVYGAFGGRFDQEMASMQALYRWAGEFRHRMILYSDETCAFLLPSGVRNEIRLPLVTGKLQGGEEVEQIKVGEGPTCGIIPLGTKCESVVTTGLKWNLNGSAALEFGGLVSTSNRIIEDVVTVQASHPLIFTAEIIS